MSCFSIAMLICSIELDLFHCSEYLQNDDARSFQYSKVQIQLTNIVSVFLPDKAKYGDLCFCHGDVAQLISFDEMLVELETWCEKRYRDPTRTARTAPCASRSLSRSRVRVVMLTA